ncbi:hypothetical protein ONZ45_g15856 [Pleurotus djamor]|nr:hypothetical protein ONZ45_g15856 [Pleurotus djamor]
MPAPQPSYPVSSPSLGSSFLSQPDHGLGTGHFIDVSDFSTTSSTISNDTVNAGSQRTASVDDFGVGMGGPTGSGPSGGRFATFPVKSKMGTSQPIVNEQPSGEGMLNPWNAEQELYNNNTDKRASMVSESSVGLAYDRSDYGTTVDEHGMDNKHVRFGAVSDVDEEMQKRFQQQQTPSQPNVYTSPTEQASSLSISTSSSTDGRPRTSLDKTTGPSSPKSPHEPPPPAYQYPVASITERAPSPPANPVEAERELNAAAAREVSREFDSLTFKPPSVNEGGLGGPNSPPGRSSPASFNMSSPSPHETAPPGGLERDLSASPLLPPNPAFAGRDRSVSPGIPSRRPTIDVNTINVQPATPMTSSFSPSHASPISASIGANPVVSSPKIELPPVPNEALGIPDHHFEGGNDSRDDLSQRTASPAYRTPPEYHTPRLGSRSASGSVSAGGSPLPSPVPGTKTISAAAFRRPPPRKMSGDTLNSPPFAGGIGSNTISGGTGFVDTSPLVLKKRLPGSSPQPGFGGDRAASPVSSGIGGPRNASGSVSAGTGVPYSHSQLQHSQLPVEGEDDQYDYISAYVGSPGGPNETNSPRADFGNLGRGNGGAPGSREGYDQGRFTTNLDEGLR